MKQTLIAVILASALLASACTKVDSGIDTPKGKTEILLDLTLPAQTAIQTRGIDDSRENEVTRLDVFTFDPSGDILANVGHQTIRSFKQPTNAGGLGNKLEVSIVLDRSAAASQQFYVVANGRDDMFTGITTKTQLEAIEFTSASMPRYLFVMTGYSPLLLVASLTSLPLTLTRSVARIDVSLAASVNNFAIKSGRIMQGREGAYAFQKKSGGYVTWPAASALADYATVNLGSEHERKFTSKLYAYENYNSNALDLDKTTVVILGGDYNTSGTTTYYRIDIMDNNGDLQILRNNRYEITVNSVDGPGSVTEEDAVIGTANIRYTIDVWKESDVNAEFDGTTSLKVSENNIRLPRDASGGIIHVETTADTWTYSAPVNTDGTSAGWLAVRKDGDNCNYMATVNSSGMERTAYFYIRAGQKLKIKVKVSQAFGDAMVISLSSTGITVPAEGTTSIPVSTNLTAERENVSWVIDNTIVLLGDKSDLNWVRFVNLQPMTGTGNGRVELNVSALTVPNVNRTGIVKIAATDVSTGVTEYYKFTVTQNTIAEYIKVDRTYIASTQTGAIHKITVSSNTKWIAQFKGVFNAEYSNTINYVVLTNLTTRADFVADASGTPLAAGNPKQTNLRYEHTGDGVVYVKFRDLAGTAAEYNGYIVFSTKELPTSGFPPRYQAPPYVRIHQGVYGVVTINGKTILDRNLGAVHYFDNRAAPATIGVLNNLYGNRYQWGRVSEGYETAARNNNPLVNIYKVQFNHIQMVDRMPAYGIITGEDHSGFILGNWNSWFNVTPNTPNDQREFHKFWDGNGKINSNSSNTATDGTGWTGLIENTNAVGVKTKFDPCPKGWRVPTAVELRDIFEGGDKILSDFPTTADKGRWMVSDGGGGKNVFFPAAGALSKGALLTTLYAPSKTDNTSSLTSIGTECYYMSSSLAGDQTTYWYYFFDNTTDKGIRWNRHPKTNSTFMIGCMSIRCIKDEVGIY